MTGEELEVAAVFYECNAGEEKPLPHLTSLWKKGQDCFPSLKSVERGFQIWGSCNIIPHRPSV